MTQLVPVVVSATIIYKYFRLKDGGKIKMTSEVEEVISNLKFIGKIQKGEKINVKYMYARQNSVITRLIRTFIDVDTRENALQFFKCNINRALEFINNYLCNHRVLSLHGIKTLIGDIKQAIEGMNNFKESYTEDRYFCNQIDTFIQNTIQARLNEIEPQINAEKEDFVQ